MKKFREGKYVLIGGAACDFAMSEAGLHFRTTNDIYIFLIMEALDEEFFHIFWNFKSRRVPKQAKKQAAGEK
jgi:hypothetical protein